MRAVVACLGVALAAAGAQAQAQPSPQEDPLHRYVLEASLDPGTHTVRGTARITWVNEAEVPAEELWLHLYLNAFASEDTVFMRESGGSLRGDRAHGEGGIVLEALETRAGQDLLAGADDEVIAGDRTQLRVPLPQAVPPGGRLELAARFVSTLPPVFARSGHAGSFHMVAQWFPKLAVRERDGTWATFPYHGHGEFYADFARYELTVETPASFLVGATGRMVDEQLEGDRVTRRFVADRVHDVAFCAWDRFEERTVTEGGVEVRFLHPPGYAHALARHVHVTVAGLRHFGALFGDYPYPTLTVIVPPRGAEGAAGMEYPQLFLTAGEWYAVPGLPIGSVEATTAHELAHQWFQGMLASHEVHWPMLDEGITQWATGDLLRRIHGQGRSAVAWGPLEVDFFQLMRVLALRGRRPTPPPGSPAHAFRDASLGRAVYARTSVILDTVGRVWGSQRLEAALGLYAREQRFRHPTPDDLYDAFDRTYWRGFSRSVLEPALMENAVADVRMVSLASREAGELWVSEVEAQRVGSLPLPTWVELRGADGSRTRLPWPGDAERFRATHSSAARVVAARIDPDDHLLLDPSVLDNLEQSDGARGSGNLLSRILFGAQQLLAAVGP